MNELINRWMYLCEVVCPSFGCVEQSTAAGVGHPPSREGGSGEGIGGGKQRLQDGDLEAARRDGGHPQGAPGHHGHEARTGTGDRCLPEAARGRGEQVIQNHVVIGEKGRTRS